MPRARRPPERLMGRVMHSDTFGSRWGATFYAPTGWHHEMRCTRCGSVVDFRDERLHSDDHEERDQLAQLLARLAAAAGIDPDAPDRPEPEGHQAEDLARRADEYGEAAGYDGRGSSQFRAIHWAGGVRQIGAMMAADWAWFRGLARRRTEPAQAGGEVPADPSRQAQWDRMRG